MRLIPNILRGTCALLAVFLTVSCGFNNSIVSLDYRPDLGQQLPGPRLVGVGHFSDLRRQGYYNLGTVRSPIGTPMETVSTRVPVENIVRNGFGRGLGVRGMLATLNTAPYLISGEILNLQVEQYVHPTASARLRVNLVRASDGRIVYSRVFEASHQSGAYMPGSGSPIPELRELVSRVLQSVIDQALDSRGLRNKLTRQSATQQASDVDG